MAKRPTKRIHRELTPEEQQRWKRANKEAESQKEEILAKGHRMKAARNQGNVAGREAMKASGRPKG
jgi:hypothetical protein